MMTLSHKSSSSRFFHFSLSFFLSPFLLPFPFPFLFLSLYTLPLRPPASNPLIGSNKATSSNDTT